MSGSRTIYVTGGRKDYARATLTDDLGHDLSTATIRPSRWTTAGAAWSRS